jgi:hypothetical protein
MKGYYTYETLNNTTSKPLYRTRGGGSTRKENLKYFENEQDAKKDFSHIKSNNVDIYGFEWHELK